MTIFTTHQERGIMASQIIAYTNPIKVFLNSSSFHLFIIRLNQKYKKTHTATSASIENKKVLNDTKTFVNGSVPFPVTQTVWVFGNISACRSAYVCKKEKYI